MLMTCKCLNVIIEGKGDKCEIMDKSLKSILGNDDFFKEDIGTVELVGITTKVQNAIEAYRSGPWVIHRCLNCGVYIYAYNKDADVNTIIVNCSLSTNESEIAALKNSELYSLVFNILVNDKEAVSISSTEISTDSELHVKLKEWIEEQKIITEERVQAFIDQQYADLEKRKVMAHREHIALSRVISKKKKVPPRDFTVKLSNCPLKEIKTTYEKDDPIQCNTRLNPTRTSFDTEGLFALDDIEDPGPSDRIEDHISEGSENNDENGQITRRDGIAGHFARSLPVAVPQFVQDRQQNDSNSGSPNVPTDIAASIKKLAKSVHGDTIFGELPRPRFSTNL